MVNESFRDRYNPNTTYQAGLTYQFTAARVEEIKDVNPNLITVIGVERSEEESNSSLAAALEEAEKAKKEAEKAKKEAEKLKKQLEELTKG